VETKLAQTGIAGLDDVLGGGLPAGRMYLVQGDPGVGKTTLALQFLLAGAARGEPGLLVTLSETDEEIRSVAASHGWPLDNISLFELSAFDQTTGLEEENTVFEPSETDLQETTRKILARVDQVRPARVVFDSLTEIRLLSQTALRYRRQLLGLKQHFSEKPATVVLVDEVDPRAPEGDMQLQSLSHGVIEMEQIPPAYGEDRRRLRIVKLRGRRFRGGHHDFVIRKGGLVVFPRLVAAEHHAVFERQPISSGIADLDTLLGGGIDRGTSTLFMGPAGTGKSALSTQFAVAAARRGETAAIFAFDEALGTLFARSEALAMDLPAQVKAGRVIAQQIDPAEMGPGEFAYQARRLVEEKNARVVIIDSLNGYLNAMPDERLLTVQLHELLSYLGQRGVATILVMAQHGMMGLDSPIELSYLADSIVLLRYFEAGGRIHKAISMVKKRSGAHEDAIRELVLSAGGLRIGPVLKEFRGVLTGVPEFTGNVERLMER
jgi:circadian clock protein KaiC